jgi:hypothetical protein
MIDHSHTARLEVVILPAAVRDAQATAAAVSACGSVSLSTNAGLQAAARTLGLTVDQLTQRLWAGECLGRLAEAAGTDLQTVEKAVTAATEVATRAAIACGVAEGVITGAHAHWLVEGLEAGYWGGATDGFALGSQSRRRGATQRG